MRLVKSHLSSYACPWCLGTSRDLWESIPSVRNVVSVTILDLIVYEIVYEMKGEM